MKYPFTEADAKAVMANLPTLEAGECFLCDSTNNTVQKIRIGAKRTIHPDRKAPRVLVPGKAVSVEEAVNKLKASLEKKAMPASKAQTTEATSASPVVEGIVKDLRARNDALKEQISQIDTTLAAERAKTRSLLQLKSDLRKALQPLYEPMKKLFEWTEEVVAVAGSADSSRYEVWRTKLNKGENQMLNVFIAHKRLNGEQLRVAMGMNRETVRIYRGKLMRCGLVKKDGTEFILVEGV